MSSTKKAAVPARSLGTTRIPPLSAASRSTTPLSAPRASGTAGTRASNAGAGGSGTGSVSASAIVPPTLPAGQQKLLDKDRKMVEYSVGVAVEAAAEASVSELQSDRCVYPARARPTSARCVTRIDT